MSALCIWIRVLRGCFWSNLEKTHNKRNSNKKRNKGSSSIANVQTIHTLKNPSSLVLILFSRAIKLKGNLRWYRTAIGLKCRTKIQEIWVLLSSLPLTFNVALKKVHGIWMSVSVFKMRKMRACNNMLQYN